MTAALRSPDRLGKPRRPRSVWAAVRVFVVPPVVALTLLLAVRGLAVTQVSLPADRPELGLLAGDRVLVDRTAFGLCLPLPGREAPLRAGGREPRRGELVAYEAPGTAEGVRVGRIDGLPGDSLGGGTEGCLVPGTYRAGGDIIARERLIGRLMCVSYSVDRGQPFGKRLRRHRFFLRLP